MVYPTECGRSVGRYVIGGGGGGQKVPRSSPHPTHSLFFLIGPIARSVECLLHESTLPNGMFFLEQNHSSIGLRKRRKNSLASMWPANYTFGSAS